MNDELKIPKNVAVRDIAFDEDGTIWLATTRGLGKFENNSFTLYSESDGLIRSDGNCDVNVGKNNEIIYSTYGYGFSVFNGEKYIDQSIDSILSQTYKNFTLIIIDDASNDTSCTIVNSYALKDSLFRDQRQSCI